MGREKRKREKNCAKIKNDADSLRPDRYLRYKNTSCSIVKCTNICILFYLKVLKVANLNRYQSYLKMCIVDIRMTSKKKLERIELIPCAEKPKHQFVYFRTPDLIAIHLGELSIFSGKCHPVSILA